MYRRGFLFALVVLTLCPTLNAQRIRRSVRSQEQPRTVELEGVPGWLKDHEFKQESFTFVRIRYDGGAGRRRSSWATDFPAADLNLAAQIGILTKLDVSEPSRVLRLTDPALPKHQFIYLSEPGTLELNDAEIKALREYLIGGGFLMIDDFWGDAEWENLRSVTKRVFPDHEPRDLPLSHPLFHCVFDLKEKPQVPSISHFLAGRRTERFDAPAAHFRGLVDDNGRVMVIMCHNTDLADGWERAGMHAAYTREMSQPKAFPMGINIVFYALTQTDRK
ncbi:MAG: DUF4159 domain-containing protein [Planctomycetota bacterium]|jgi:hypothetical protein